MQKPQEIDTFARIAVQRQSERHLQLSEPPLIPVPDIDLPLSEESPVADWVPLERSTTAEELRAELDHSIESHRPFLRELAPAIELQRIRQVVPEFDWREECESDRVDFFSTLAGDGKWERVIIPHYGPPLGKAVTYYRTTVGLSPEMLADGALFLCFKGVDYFCQVYLNGICLGSHEGFFAPFEFDCTCFARVGENVLVVRVENDAPFIKHGGGVGYCGDKIYAATGPGYDDPERGWHHCPPGMGIYQEVAFEKRSRLFISDVWVRTLDRGDNEGAAARVEAWIEVSNCDTAVKPVELELSVFGSNFEGTVVKADRRSPRTIQLRGFGDLKKFEEEDTGIDQRMGAGVNFLRFTLEVPQARLWELDSPWLYQLQVRLLDESGLVVDTVVEDFGVRTFEQDEESDPKGRFLLNGREIRLRGANTMGHEQQCVMEGRPQQLIEDILLAKLCHMNFLRLTQRPVQKEIYRACDRLGLMIQTDLPLFGALRRNKLLECVRQSSEMERLVRPHACTVLSSFINEPFPNAEGEPHRHVTRDEMHDFFEMAMRAIRLENPDRVIKCCDGDYDPPAPFGMPDNHCYCGWYIGQGVDLGKLHHGYWMGVKSGWHYGCGEFGAEGLDPVDLMIERYPASWLPDHPGPDAEWNPQRVVSAQSWNFHFLWYPTPRTMQEWVDASHEHQAWVARTMTEAFRRDHRMNTIAIHLFIDAWPAGWMKTIMDVERQPKKAYFAYRDALTPLMVSLRSDRTAFFSSEEIPVEAWICNDSHELPEGAELRYRLEMDGELLEGGIFGARIPACSSAPQGRIRFRAPDVADRSTLTARLALVAGGRTLHESTLEFEVFPEAAQAEPTGRFHVVGVSDGPAAYIARHLSGEPANEGPLGEAAVILIDDVKELRKHHGEIEAAVRGGATAVVLELPPGEHRLGSGELRVVPGGMGERHFVSCDTGHPLVEGLRRSDLRFWHDESTGYVTPLLKTVIARSEGWDPVLTSGNGDWQHGWSCVPAVVERREGDGCWRVCQVTLGDRLKTNPAALQFTRALASLVNQEASV